MGNANSPELHSDTVELDCRGDFPILNQTIGDNRLVFLDSAASAQRPQAVLDAVAYYETHDHANVHRGVHTLSQRATDDYEGARDKLAQFINAGSRREIVFTRGTTEAINLVAASFVAGRIKPGDEILITHLEHHANIVPWQMLAEKTGARLVVAPVNDRGELEFEAFLGRLSESTRLVAAAHVSNALGTVLPVEEMITAAHERGIPVLLDGAQGVPHGHVDVQSLNCDFYAFSGHKMYGPTGIGVLYAREALLESMPPWQGGGDMILEVSFDGTTYNEIPYKFEAGTPNISGAVGLGAAVDYLNSLGLENVAAHEAHTLDYLTHRLKSIDGLRLIGTAANKVSVASFIIGTMHPHDIGTILDHQGIAVRTGHHCAMPVMQRFGIPGTARASLGVYNTTEDVDRLVEALAVCQEMLG